MYKVSTISALNELMNETMVYAVIVFVVAVALAWLVSRLIPWEGGKDRSYVKRRIAFIIIGREITISALREWMAKLGAAKSVAVNSLGKIKTIIQMVAIPMLLYYHPWLGLDLATIGTWLIWLAAAMTIISMLSYLYSAWQMMRER